MRLDITPRDCSEADNGAVYIFKEEEEEEEEEDDVRKANKQTQQPQILISQLVAISQG